LIFDQKILNFRMLDTRQSIINIGSVLYKIFI